MSDIVGLGGRPREISDIIGLDGRPIDEEKRLVNIAGQEISAEQVEEPANVPPIDPATQARFKFQTIMGKLVDKVAKKTMSRGDLAEASRLLSQATHLVFQMLSMAMSDVMNLINQFEQAKFNNFFMGNQIAALIELSLEKGTFTKEELDTKWKDIMEKAKEDMIKAREEQLRGEEEGEECECCTGYCEVCEGCEEEKDAE